VSAQPGQRRLGPVLAALLIGGATLLAGCDRTESVQGGYRGVGMWQLSDPSDAKALQALNQIPAPEPQDPPDPSLPLASQMYKSVQVLGDLNVLQFTRLMQALSTWVAPQQGCEYCHNVENLASDEKYTKNVARRMLQMTRQINSQWKLHVANTGVTCWTCHRGQPVPSGTWFTNPGPRTASGAMGYKGGQNTQGVAAIGHAALPYDPLTEYLVGDKAISVQATQALGKDRPATKQTEWTYALMMYVSKSLGVNCTYCHNTRAMGVWDQSTPKRTTAWYGIRMVRQLNEAYLNPLLPLYPANRLGKTGDAPKVACETCHKGVYKPLYGISMLPDYPELAGVLPPPAAPQDPSSPVPQPVPEAAAADAPSPNLTANP